MLKSIVVVAELAYNRTTFEHNSRPDMHYAISLLSPLAEEWKAPPIEADHGTPTKKLLDIPISVNAGIDMPSDLFSPKARKNGEGTSEMIEGSPTQYFECEDCE